MRTRFTTARFWPLFYGRFLRVAILAPTLSSRDALRLAFAWEELRPERRSAVLIEHGGQVSPHGLTLPSGYVLLSNGVVLDPHPDRSGPGTRPLGAVALNWRRLVVQELEAQRHEG